jgi:hypothetical protein
MLPPKQIRRLGPPTGPARWPEMEVPEERQSSALPPGRAAVSIARAGCCLTEVRSAWRGSVS